MGSDKHIKKGTIDSKWIHTNEHTRREHLIYVVQQPPTPKEVNKRFTIDGITTIIQPQEISLLCLFNQEQNSPQTKKNRIHYNSSWKHFHFEWSHPSLTKKVLLVSLACLSWLLAA